MISTEEPKTADEVIRRYAEARRRIWEAGVKAEAALRRAVRTELAETCRGRVLPPRAVVLYDQPIGPPRRDWVLVASATPPRRPIAAIVTDFCARNGIAATELRAKRRDRHIVRLRHELIWLLRNETEASLPVIGRHVGLADHSSVLHALRSHEAKLNGATLYRPPEQRKRDAARAKLSKELAREARNRAKLAAKEMGL